MIFKLTKLPGVILVCPELRQDARGFFARTFCEREFAEQNLPQRFVQSNLSYNQRRGTLRGMHFQREPAPEPKLVRCSSGAIYDVIVDLRSDSPTYCTWESFELTAANHLTLYVPPGCAHGFETLEDDTEVLYQMGEFYHPSLASGVRWNDPVFGISWPISDPLLSDRDRTYPDFQA